MSLFSFKDKETNPYLSKRELIKFSNSYSNHVWTVKALSFALTEANQYNDIDYYNANTLIDVAKESGLKNSLVFKSGHQRKNERNDNCHC